MGQGAKPEERTGVRQKGTTNKRTVAIADKLAELSCNLIEVWLAC